jgi:5'-3' exonuclease
MGAAVSGWWRLKPAQGIWIMGIPSFYRQLCRRFPRIVQTGATKGGAAWLCLDFNCAMYHVLRQQPPVSEATSKAAWEAAFCDAIATYMREIVDVVAPTAGVYVSCDGVVCAAKRRQQRLRRFKGPWFSAAERAVKRGAGATAEEVAGSGWNQNALTPGSAFMARLGDVLVAAGRRLAVERGLDVRVSTTDEPGEGEHKLLAHMRSVGGGGPCMIYGLDADLILLAMLLEADTGAEVTLLREAQEFESAGRAGEWRCLYVRELVRALGIDRPDRVRDFVAAMSLLGNDFLPRSLTRTVRDDGIPMLIGALERDVWGEGRTFVAADGSGIRREGLLGLLRGWAASEEADMLRAAQGAVVAARRPVGVAASPVETAMREWQGSPARWCTVGRLLNGKGGSGLRADWRETVRGPFGSGPVEDYLAGLAWVWDYYSGRSVCQGWVYDHHLPPLWGDVVSALESGGTTLSAPVIAWPAALPPSIHLLSVLPADSVEELLPPATARRIGAAPWYWPSVWSLYDVGRSQMWECEPVIPLIPERILRGWVA